MKAIVLLALVALLPCPSFAQSTVSKPDPAKLAEFHRWAKETQALIARDEDKFEIVDGTRLFPRDYINIGGIGGVVAPGSLTSKLNAEEKQAWSDFIESSSRGAGFAPPSKRWYEDFCKRVASGEFKDPSKYPSPKAKKDLADGVITQKEFDEIRAKLDKEIIDEQQYRASIVLEFPKLIPVLTYEIWGARWECDAAIKLAISSLETTEVTSR